MASAETEGNLSRVFSAEPGGHLVVDVEDGDVEVKTGESDQIAVDVFRKVSAKDPEIEREILDDHEITFRQDGNTVTVIGKRKSKRRFWNLRNLRFQVRYVISIPREFNADLKTSDGDVRVDDLVGDLKVRSSDGDLKLGNIRGPVRGTTSDGDISLGQCIGALELRSSDGTIRIDKVEGEVAAKTSDGDIYVEEVHGKLEASTSDGDISATFASPPVGDCRLRTSDGDIAVRLVETAALSLDIRTSDGDIVSDFPVVVQGKLKDNILRGTINGGGYQLELRTSDGDVELRKL